MRMAKDDALKAKADAAKTAAGEANAEDTLEEAEEGANSRGKSTAEEAAATVFSADSSFRLRRSATMLSTT